MTRQRLRRRRDDHRPHPPDVQGAWRAKAGGDPGRPRRPAPRPRVDNAMVKALARAYRWRNSSLATEGGSVAAAAPIAAAHPAAGGATSGGAAVAGVVLEVVGRRTRALGRQHRFAGAPGDDRGTPGRVAVAEPATAVVRRAAVRGRITGRRYVALAGIVFAVRVGPPARQSSRDAVALTSPAPATGRPLSSSASIPSIRKPFDPTIRSSMPGSRARALARDARPQAAGRSTARRSPVGQGDSTSCLPLVSVLR